MKLESAATWNIIPFCAELIDRIAPQRALILGLEGDRWGFILHERLGTTSRKGLLASMALEAVEAQPDRIKSHHRQFFNRLHETDPVEFLLNLRTRYDLIVINHILEDLTAQRGRELIELAVGQADYVVLTARLSEDWYAGGLEMLPLIQSLVVADHHPNPAGLFLFSKEDPAKLRKKMASPATVSPAGSISPEIFEQMRQIIRKIQEKHFELDYIKRHATYRLAMRLLHHPAWRIARAIRNRGANLVTIRALGQRGEHSQGCEVWLLGARHSADAESVPWDFMEPVKGDWLRKNAGMCPYGQCYVAIGRATLRLPLMSEDPILEFMTHPFSGKVEISYKGRSRVVDLWTKQGGNIQVFIGRPEMPAFPIVNGSGGQRQDECAKLVSAKTGATSGADAASRHEWLEKVRREPIDVLAIYTPRWLGITRSTEILFEHTRPFPHSAQIEPYSVSDATIREEAETLLASGIKHFVASGGDEIQYKLMCELKKRDPAIRFDLLWHGAYVRFIDDYEWRLIKMWVGGAHDGLVHTIGTVKKGMEQLFGALGVRSRLVMNYNPQIPEAPSEPEPGGPHLGIWMSGFNMLKNPYSMIAAARLIPGALLHGSNFDLRALDVVNFLGLSCERIGSGPLPPAQLLERISTTHLSLYVTFTECCPMLPLESFGVGVPCLVGPTSHLFEENDYLRDRLVVPYPDRADVIARYIEGAVAERDQLVAEYRRYAEDYNDRARGSVLEFLAD